MLKKQVDRNAAALVTHAQIQSAQTLRALCRQIPQLGIALFSFQTSKILGLIAFYSPWFDFAAASSMC